MENIGIRLRVANKGLTQVVDYVQGTNTIPIVFDIVDYNITAGATANIYIKKPSGAQIYNSCSISGNEITVNPTTQMFAESGKQLGQLQILNGQKILESFLILFNVEKSIVDTTAAESTDEFTALETALASIKGSAESAADAVEQAEQALQDANTAITGANAAATNANNIAQEIEEKAEAGDFNATIEIGSTVTGAPGTQAIVTNSGTNKDVVLNFTIPKGEPGEVGNLDEQPITFSESQEKSPLESGDALGTLFGKTKKYQSENDDVIYEIGGRNLIQNKFFDEAPWLDVVLDKETTYKGKNCMHVAHTKLYKNTANGIEAIFPELIFEENTQYVLRVEWCATSASGNISRMHLKFNYTDGTIDRIINNSEEWTTQTLVSDPSKTVSKITTTYGATANGTYIANLKLEIGSTPTRWTPAPEDIEDEIDDKLSSTGNGSPLTVDFTEAASVADIVSGSTLAALFGQILKNQNDFLDSDTIQAAEDAGILSGGGLTLLNSILQLCLENVILEEYDNDIWHVKKYVNGDIEICGTYITQTQYPITTPYGQIYRYGSDFGISLPEQLINPQDSQAYVSIMSNGTDFAGKVRLENFEQYSNVKFAWLNPTSYTAGASARIQFFVKGKWK